ncbi:MAG: DUF3971 domain-containing protein [Parvularculaceae bacterium]
MKSRLARAGLIAAEALGLVIAATLAIVAFVCWRAQSGPSDLGWAAPAIRAAANAALEENSVKSIGEASLSRTHDNGGYRLLLENVAVGTPEDPARANLPTVEVVFFPQDFVAGKAGPRRILVDGAHLQILRRADFKLELKLGGAGEERADAFRALTGGRYFRQAFERAELKNVSIDFLDEATGRTWYGRNGAVSVVRTQDGYAADAKTNFKFGEQAASLDLRSTYNIDDDIIAALVMVDKAPVGDLLAVFFGSDAEPLTSPISGSAAIEISSSGAVRSSHVDLSAGEGRLTIGGWSTPIERFDAVADFDPSRNEFNVENITWNGGVGAGELTGLISLTPKENGRGVGNVKFNLAARETTIDFPGALDAPLKIDEAAAIGDFDVGAKTLEIEKIGASFLGLSLSGDLSILSNGAEPTRFKAAIELGEKLGPAKLLKFWPTKIANGAREFIATRMRSGVLSEIEFRVDLQPDLIGANGAIPDEALEIRFRADSAEVDFAPGMTTMKGVSGKGILRGNSFRFDAENARVGAVRIIEGEVDIPVLAPKGQPAYYRFSAEGDAGAMLAILDEEPLAVLKDSHFKAEQFSGPVRARAEIIRPNLRVAPPDSYQYRGTATFSELQVENIIGDATLTGAKGELDLKTEGMAILGDAFVADAQVEIDWRQSFFGDGDKTKISVSGRASAAAADLLGIPTRQIVQGEVPFTAEAVGGVDALRRMEIAADFTDAVLVSAPLGWIKPAGVSAHGSATVLYAKTGNEISAFSLDADGTKVNGSAAFDADGAIRVFEMPVFKLANAADLSMNGGRDEAGVLAVNVEGRFLNAGELVRTFIDEGAGEGVKTATNLTAKIDRLTMRGGVEYSNATLNFARNADYIENLHLSASGAEGAPLSADLKTAEDGAAYAIEAKSEDVGSMLGAIFGLSSVKGGTGRLDFAFTPGDKNAPGEGALEAHDLRVVRAPLFAKIFAAGSLTGLADLLNGEGIEFRNAMARFTIAGGEVEVHESRATGPSVGITAKGEFDLEGEKLIALKGAVAPAYGVNSLLGKAPVIGGLFVSRKGEGLLALSYDVGGPASEPRVTVNPLSAFTPGVFRRMFEGRAETNGETAETGETEKVGEEASREETN